MNFKPNHGHYVGRIIREGKHHREVVFSFGPFYSTQPYRVNGPLFPEKVSLPHYQDDDLLLEMLNNSIRKDELKFR